MTNKRYRINNRIKITNSETGETISLKKYRKEADRKYLLVSHIVGKKILSKTELEKLVASGILEEVSYRNRRCIDRATLVNYLSKRLKDRRELREKEVLGESAH